MILKFTSGTQECVSFFYSVDFYFANRAENLCCQFNHGRKLLPQFRKIFGAVSRTISLMRLSALLAIKRCRCRDDGFCSGFAFRNYSLKKRHCGDGFCHFTMLPFLAD